MPMMASMPRTITGTRFGRGDAGGRAGTAAIGGAAGLDGFGDGDVADGRSRVVVMFSFDARSAARFPGQ